MNELKPHRPELHTDIPASRVVAGVRVGLLPDQGFVVNPTIEQMEESTLDLVIAGVWLRQTARARRFVSPRQSRSIVS